MKGTKTEENTANKANMTNRRDTRAKEKVSEKNLGKSGKKRENEPRERTMTFMKLENIVREKRRAERRNNGNGRVENTLPVSRAMVWHPKQIRETCSGREENNTNRKRRHASFVPRTCPQSSRGLESTEKQTNARVQIFNTTTLGLLHKLDGFSMSTHAGRMRGQSLKHLPLQIHCESPHLHKNN